MSTIRVALVTNALGPPVRGNGTTVHRWLGWLPDVDVHVTPIGPDFDLPRGRSPDIVHGYHAIHGGLHAQRLAKENDLPLVISLGGTDLLSLKDGAEDALDVGRVLREAVLVTGAFPGFGRTLAELVPDAPPYAVVPRGVHVSEASPCAPSTDRVRVLLPAGIRPVKDPIAAVDQAIRLHERGVPIHLLVAGPTLDEEYEQRFQAHLKAMGNPPFIDWWESIPRTDMPHLYGTHDVVWNTSVHEGGPNALLEGLAHGCAAMARDVPGNRDLFSAPDSPGRLASLDGTDAELDALADWHNAIRAETPSAREARVAGAREWLRTHHDSQAEVAALRSAYEQVLKGR